MPIDTLVRSSIQDDIFDLELTFMESRDGIVPGEINLSLGTYTGCVSHDANCDTPPTSVTCSRTCGGISGHPCAC